MTSNPQKVLLTVHRYLLHCLSQDGEGKDLYRMIFSATNIFKENKPKHLFAFIFPRIREKGRIFQYKPTSLHYDLTKVN
jgi:hypothetical protein